MAFSIRTRIEYHGLIFYFSIWQPACECLPECSSLYGAGCHQHVTVLRSDANNVEI